MTAMRIFCIVSDKGRTFIGMSKLFGNIEEELSKSELLFILLNKILTILFKIIADDSMCLHVELK